MSRLVYSSSITKVRFGVSGTEDIVQDSFVNITSHDLFKNNLPYPGGVYDSHLGTTDHTYNCSTCYNDKKQCLGHDGQITLNYPIQSPLFMSEIKKWLRVICFHCGQPIALKQEYERFSKLARLTETYKLVRGTNRSCPNCAKPHHFITMSKENPMMFIAEERADKEVKSVTKLYPHMIEIIFLRISNETVEAMGKSPSSHPRKFILRAVRVPPTTIRPDVKRAAGGKSNNDHLTMLLQNIVKENEKLPPVLPEEIDHKLEALIYALNGYYYAFVKGSTGKHTITGTGNAPVNSLTIRLKGKQGRFRRTLQGKRVRVVARTTITGDPTIKIDELGIPLRFAKTLQVEETVQEYNKNRLMINFLNGRTKYPGCTKVIKRNTRAEHSIDSLNNNVELQIGDKIYRDLETGDYVLFNRQPSLLPSSVSAHRIVVTMDPEILTFRMNVIVCPLYNADFDGDQMNVYVAPNVASRNEIEQLSSVPNWFIKHANGSPLIGQADDSIIGNFCLTRKGVEFDKYHAMLLFSNSTYLPDFKTKGNITSWEVISKALEETPIYYNNGVGFYKKELAPYMNYDPDETKLVIDHGRHVSGVIDKKNVGKGAIGGIYHVIANEYGAKKSIEVVFNMQQLAIAYMYQHGFTIGINDMMISKKSLDKVHDIEAGLIQKSRLITEQLDRGEIIPPVGSNVEQHYERLQIEALRAVDDFIDPIFESIDVNTNNLLQLVLSGSKGSINHIFHISSAVGQIVINDDRPKLKFAYKRSLPHFARFDTEPGARGFIKNSYISGMTSTEFAYNAQNARFDLISKALSTSVTGESNRKSIKNLEPIIVDNLRMPTRGSRIVQMCYGEDGIDARKVVKVVFPTVGLSDEDFKKYKYVAKEASLQAVFDGEYETMEADREKYRKTFLRLESINVNEPMSDRRDSPVDVELTIRDAIHRYGEHSPSEKELAEMVGVVRELCEKLPYNHLNEIQAKAKAPVPAHIKSAVWTIAMLTRSHLCARGALARMNRKVLEVVLSIISVKHVQSLIDYGSPVGVIAAMSFSEPLTQYMLDAHHRTTTGGTSKSVMNEVREILGAKPTEKLAAPSMVLTPLPEYNSEAVMRQVANYIEMSTMKDYTRFAQVFFERFGEPVHPKFVEEKSMIAEFMKYNPLLKVPEDLIKWCIRVVLDKSKMIYKNMQLEMIVTKLRESFPDLFIIHNNENAKEVIVRVYIRATHFKGHAEKDDIMELLDALLSTTIRGVNGIRAAEVIRTVRSRVDSSGKITREEGVLAIKTLGTNVKDMFKIAAIDPYLLQTDALEETMNVFGIEAARQRLITSIRNLGAGGLNHHHVTVYADEMTFTGKITSIEKQGLSAREQNQVLLRMGFSAPIQTLEEAGVNAMTDPMQGLTAPLLVGTTPTTIGTAYNKFYINEAMVRENTVRADDWLDDL